MHFDWRLFGLKSPSEQLSLAEFLLAVGQLKFRGTSLLFRLKKTIVQLLNALNAELISRKRDFRDYELAAHSVKVKRSGAVSDISTLWEIDGRLLKQKKVSSKIYTRFTFLQQ